MSLESSTSNSKASSEAGHLGQSKASRSSNLFQQSLDKGEAAQYF